MRIQRTFLPAALFVLSASLLAAQAVTDPSGHWEGAVNVQDQRVIIEVDLARNGQGMLTGTFNQPGQQLEGLPLTNLTVEGTTVSFQVKGSAPGDRVFRGFLSPDGTSMSGVLAQGGFSLPFELSRNGEARIETPAKSAAVGAELEGTWTSTLDIQGVQRRLVLTIVNEPDATATGNIHNVDEGLDFPVASIAQEGARITFQITAVGASLAGTLSASNTEVVGTLTQGAAVVPLTFRRAAPEIKQ